MKTEEKNKLKVFGKHTKSINCRKTVSENRAYNNQAIKQTSFTNYFKLAVALFVFLIFSQGIFAIQNLLALQGNVNNAGVPVNNGNITVTIWNQSVGGILIYNSSDDYRDAISNGIFDIMLGDGSQELVIEYGKTYYMDISVNNQDLDFNGSERRIFQSGIGRINGIYINNSTINTSHIVDGAILNSDISASASIDKTKIAATNTWSESEIPSLTSSWLGTLNASRILSAGLLNVNSSTNSIYATYLGGFDYLTFLSNDTALSSRIDFIDERINSINSTKLDAADQRYNETELILTVNSSITGNPFNQVLNTTSNATFNSVSASVIVGNLSGSTFPSSSCSGGSFATGLSSSGSVTCGGISQRDIPSAMSWGYITGGSTAATTIASVGLITGTATGTVTDSNDADGRAKNILSGSAAGNTAKISTTVFATTRTAYNPNLIVKMKPVEYTAERIWIGFTSAAFTNVDTHAANTIAIRGSTVVPDGDWMFCSREGITQTCNDTNVAIVAKTAYTFNFTVSSNLACVSINGGAPTCKTDNLPLSTQDMGMETSVITTAAFGKNQTFYYMYFREGTGTTPMILPNIRVWGHIIGGSTAATTIASSGLITGTATGTVTDSNDADGRAKNIASAGTLGSTAKISTTVFAATTTAYNPNLVVKMKPTINLTGSERIWIGFTSVAFPNADTHTGNTLAVRFSTVVPDANWMFCSRDGITQTCNDTLVPAIAGTAYTFNFTVTSSLACVSINGGGQTCKTDNLPLSTQNLGIEDSIITNENTTRNQKFYYMYLEQDK